MPLKPEPAYTKIEKYIEDLYERGFDEHQVISVLSDAPGIEPYLKKFIKIYDADNPTEE